MAMCAALNTKHFKFNSYGNACNSLFALLCIALIILMPLYVAYEYIKCILSLSDDSADEEEENEAAEQQEPGRLQRLQRYKDEFVLQYLLAPELQPDFLWFYLVVQARKLLLCLTCVFLQYYDNFSLFSFMGTTVTMIIATG